MHETQPQPRRTSRKPTEASARTPLDDSLRIAAVRLARERGATPAAISIAFGISHTTAAAIVRRALANAR